MRTIVINVIRLLITALVCAACTDTRSVFEDLLIKQRLEIGELRNEILLADTKIDAANEVAMQEVDYLLAKMDEKAISSEEFDAIDARAIELLDLIESNHNKKNRLAQDLDHKMAELYALSSAIYSVCGKSSAEVFRERMMTLFGKGGGENELESTFVASEKYYGELVEGQRGSSTCGRAIRIIEESLLSTSGV